MAVIKQGGFNPHAGKMTTTTGIKEYSRRCMQCGLPKEDDIFVQNANGKMVCGDCRSNPFATREPKDGRLEDASDATE
jgi:hypothetical protein